MGGKAVFDITVVVALLLQVLLEALCSYRGKEGKQESADAGFLRTKNTNQEAMP